MCHQAIDKYMDCTFYENVIVNESLFVDCMISHSIWNKIDTETIVIKISLEREGKYKTFMAVWVAAITAVRTIKIFNKMKLFRRKKDMYKCTD